MRRKRRCGALRLKRLTLDGSMGRVKLVRAAPRGWGWPETAARVARRIGSGGASTASYSAKKRGRELYQRPPRVGAKPVVMLSSAERPRRWRSGQRRWKLLGTAYWGSALRHEVAAARVSKGARRTGADPFKGAGEPHGARRADRRWRAASGRCGRLGTTARPADMWDWAGGESMARLTRGPQWAVAGGGAGAGSLRGLLLGRGPKARCARAEGWGCGAGRRGS